MPKPTSRGPTPATTAALRAARSGFDPLEAGLVAVVVLAPVPFGSVPAGARTALEIGALALLAVWAVRAAFRPTVLPSRATLVATLGLLALGALQIAPVGSALVRLVSPRSLAVRDAVRPSGEARAAEARLVGTDPSALDAVPTSSIDPGATASALRTGTALVALLLVATAVGATVGLRRIALALLVAAALQGLYGILVLASDDPHILHRVKQHYVDCATGTFVNRNHYAAWLAMALACGLSVLLLHIERARRSGDGRAAWAGPEAGKVALVALGFVVGTAGLLTSFSRAGIAAAAVSIGLAAIAGSGSHRLRLRLAVALLLAAAATLPLLQVGSDRLVERYAASADHLVADGGRARVWGDTLRMAAAFPAVGSGFGSFSVAYPAFRSPDVRYFYAHAHNDLVQVAAEGGAVALALAIVLALSVGRAVLRGLRGELGIVGAGTAAGLAGLVLHSLVDFDFHVPASAATAAVLAGLLEGASIRADRGT
jgi:hypothetical protein